MNEDHMPITKAVYGARPMRKSKTDKAKTHPGHRTFGLPSEALRTLTRLSQEVGYR